MSESLRFYVSAQVNSMPSFLKTLRTSAPFISGCICLTAAWSTITMRWTAPAITSHGYARALELVDSACFARPLIQSTRGLADRDSIAKAVHRAGIDHAVDVELLVAVMATESGCSLRAKSKKGAQGLMQLMPATARALGVKDAYRASDSLDGGAKYLALLLSQFDGNVQLALAAYNAGPTKVKKLKKIPPYRETQRYVKRVLSRYQSLSNLQLASVEGNVAST